MKILNFILALLVLITFTSCKDKEKLSFIYFCEDKLCQEVMNLDSSTIQNYTVDNKIYREGLRFVYDYRYLDKGTFLVGNEGHRLDTITDTNSQTIVQVSFTVSEERGRSMREMIPEYYQSGVNYDYYGKSGESFYPKTSSGLIENEINVWIHPFRRSTYFAMLNINPYPYVQYPIEVGNTYQWELGVGGSAYIDPVWAMWDGTTIRKHKYLVSGKEIIVLPFDAAAEVYVIEATATSEIGDSGATFKFSDKYGFVEMNYDNLNGSQFLFSLTQIDSTVVIR